MMVTRSSREVLTIAVACVILLSSFLTLLPISSNLAHGFHNGTVKQSIHSLTPSPAVSSPLTFSAFSQGPFAQGLNFVGIGYSSQTQTNRIIASARNGTLYLLDASGTANYFAPGFVGRNCFDCPETYFAISPGLGGFSSGDIFAGTINGPTITKISADGSTVTYDWANCAGSSPTSAELGSLQGGLAFDTVGTFNFDLLALSTNGLLFQVTSNGACFPVGGFHLPSYSTDYVEGLQVAPSSFGPLAGQAIIGGGTLGELIAISSTGVVTAPLGGFTSLGNLEAPVFVPSQGGVLFMAYGAVFVASASSFDSSDYGTLIVGGESTSTFQVRFDTAANTYALSTIGTPGWEGAVFAPATFLSSPDFSLSVSGDGLSLDSVYHSYNQQHTSTLAVSVLSLNGYSGSSITLSTEVSPSSLNPPTAIVNMGSLTLSSNSPNTPNGTYTVAILGNDGAVTRETFVSLLVGSDFSLSQGSLNAIQGLNVQPHVGASLARQGTGPLTVNLSCGGVLPPGVACSFNPVSIGIGCVCDPSQSESVLTISTSLQTPLGYNSVTIVGTGGGVTHEANLWLVVIPYDYSLSASDNLLVSQGGSVENPILVQLVGGTPQSVSLSCRAFGLPPGASCQFTPVNGNPTFTSNFLIQTLSSTPVGVYNVVVVASGQGGVNRSIVFILNVQGAGGGETTGGFVIPIDKLSLLAPYIGMTFLIVVLAFGAIIRVRRRKRNTDSFRPVSEFTAV